VFVFLKCFIAIRDVAGLIYLFTTHPKTIYRSHNKKGSFTFLREKEREGERERERERETEGRRESEKGREREVEKKRRRERKKKE
jgi:hypothetical protein